MKAPFIEVGPHGKRVRLKVENRNGRLVVVGQVSPRAPKRRTRPRRNSP